MTKYVEQPPDAEYLVAKTGFDFLKAEAALALRLQQVETNPLNSSDLVSYLSAYVEYLIRRADAYDDLPPGLPLKTLQNTSTILNRLQRGIFGMGIIPQRGKQMIRASLIRGIRQSLAQLLSTRRLELEIMINHIQMENSCLVLTSSESPFYSDLVEYHRDFVSDEESFRLDLREELIAVELLSENLNGTPPQTES